MPRINDPKEGDKVWAVKLRPEHEIDVQEVTFIKHHGGGECSVIRRDGRKEVLREREYFATRRDAFNFLIDRTNRCIGALRKDIERANGWLEESCATRDKLKQMMEADDV